MSEGASVQQKTGGKLKGGTRRTNGGDVSSATPDVLLHYVKDSWLSYSWDCSSNWFVNVREGFVMTAFSWGGGAGPKQQFVASLATDPEHIDFSQPVMWDDAFFWTTCDLYRSGINVWDPVHGARPFIRWLGDATRGAGNLGTDGADLVWVYGEGKAPDVPSIYPVKSIMTAPFTIDPAALVPRRLRSDPTPGGVAVVPFQVGCGYGVRGAGAIDTLVIRLADGVSWLFPKDPAFRITEVIGVTCTHFYALVQVGSPGPYTIARIALDSLGPGVPPD